MTGFLTICKRKRCCFDGVKSRESCRLYFCHRLVSRSHFNPQILIAMLESQFWQITAVYNYAQVNERNVSLENPGSKFKLNLFLIVSLF